MRLNRLQACLAACLVTAAGSATAAVLATAPASASSPTVVLVNPCNGHGQVRPAAYDIGCMASQEYLAGLSWTSWRSVAFGSGTLKVNDCTPTCAAGHYIKYPVLTVLWRAKARPGHPGQAYYSRLTWIFTGKRPSVVHTAAQTFTLPSS